MGTMDIKTKYNEVRIKLEQLEFGKLWEGFRPCEFALYDDQVVCKRLPHR